jgi:hypothetical protein
MIHYYKKAMLRRDPFNSFRPMLVIAQYSVVKNTVTADIVDVGILAATIFTIATDTTDIITSIATVFI